MSRRPASLGVLLGALLAALPAATAEIYVYTPDPADVGDFDHTRWYTWGIDVSELTGQVILDVELQIEDISNWDNGQNVLHIHLLDQALIGVTTGQDGEDGVDQFLGQGALIASWTDTNGSGTLDDLVFRFSELGLIPTTESYAADGILGIAFDPDCHFYNNGVRLVITASVPSPTRSASWGQLKKRYR